MTKPTKMHQGMDYLPYYRKCCEIEDLMETTKAAITAMEQAGDHMMLECVDNRGQAATAYSEIAADHMIQKLQAIVKAIG